MGGNIAVGAALVCALIAASLGALPASENVDARHATTLRTVGSPAHAATLIAGQDDHDNTQPAPWVDYAQAARRLTTGPQQHLRNAHARMIDTPTQVYVGESFALNGRVIGLHGQKPGAVFRWFELEERVGAKWRPGVWVHRRANRSFTVDMSGWDRPGTRRLRIRLVRRHATTTFGPAFSIRVVDYDPTDLPVGPPLGSPDDWTTVTGSNPDGTHVRWDPCQPIRWAFNANGTEAAYPTAVTDMTEALRRVGEKTGLTFTHVGATTYVPYRGGNEDGFPRESADLVVAFATPAEVPLLRGGAVGLGGPILTRLAVDNTKWVETAGIVLNSDFTGIDPGFRIAGTVTWGQLMTHETLHSIGLGHAHGKEQVMNPALSVSNHNFGAGDLTGMTAHGSSDGCVPLIQPVHP